VIVRAVRSTLPPGAKGTMTRIGRSGQAAAAFIATVTNRTQKKSVNRYFIAGSGSGFTMKPS